ncbi:hypothetical protein J6590_050100 [Homalodisca vitripennis]|nr:hypothetical protein J6590_050100 [Homalodisca vitripennis]
MTRDSHGYPSKDNGNSSSPGLQRFWVLRRRLVFGFLQTHTTSDFSIQVYNSIRFQMLIALHLDCKGSGFFVVDCFWVPSDEHDNQHTTTIALHLDCKDSGFFVVDCFWVRSDEHESSLQQHQISDAIALHLDCKGSGFFVIDCFWVPSDEHDESSLQRKRKVNWSYTQHSQE